MKKTTEKSKGYSKLLYTCAIIIALAACHRDEPVQFDILKSSVSGITFNPLSKKNNPTDNDIKEFGTSVAIGDLNNDGLPDIVFSGMYANPEIYINHGRMNFENTTTAAGIAPAQGFNAYGVAIIDINNDGWNDIYICANGSDNTVKGFRYHNLLYINNKDGTFTERGGDYNLDISANCYMPYFFDYDKDGDPDLFLLIWPDFDYNPFDISYLAKVKGEKNNSHSLLLENRNGKFFDVTQQRGLETLPATNNSCIIADVNGDGWPDIYVANDYVFPDQLYINHQGTFSNELKHYVSKTSMFSMGTDCADINNDLSPDLIVADMLSPGHYRRKMNTLSLTTSFYNILNEKAFPQYQRNVLQLNNGGENFSEIGLDANVSSTEWSWSPLLADFDNDGFKDLFITAGSRKELTNLDYLSNYVNASGNFDPMKQWVLDWRNIPSYQYHDFIFKNNKGLNFREETSAWGLAKTKGSEGAAYADLDNDGDLDIVVCNTNEAPYILRNNNNKLHPDKHYIRVALHPTQSSNYPTGTKAYLYTAGQTQYQEAINTKGFLSMSESMIHFGIDTFTMIDSLKIFWPSGRSQTIKKIKGDQVLNVFEKNALDTSAYPKAISSDLLTESSCIKNAFVHHEDNFDDFKRDKIIPHRISREGPAIALADINSDGAEDFYISGAKNQSGALYVQSKNGDFHPEAIAPSANKDDETAVLFFDINGDGLPDLISGIGSNAEEANDTFQHVSVFINKGAHKFEKADILPVIKYPVGTISAIDYDGHGDILLFIGCRMTQGNYGKIPYSYLLEKAHDKFYDITDAKAPQLRRIGMVTSSSFSDIDGDHDPELIVGGEFMPISIFKKIKDQWQNNTSASGLAQTNGLWNCLYMVDINNDGHLDILAGNWGDNSIWRASLSEPLSLWVNDFDGNGSTDAVLFHYLNHVNAPFVNRDLFCKQMPWFLNRFNNYESYARSTDKNIFTGGNIKDSTTILKAFTLHTSLFINDGKGHFTLKELPSYFQIAPVRDFIVHDFDHDGRLDIIPFGNTNSSFYDQGNIDALRGKIFSGDGRGNFMASAALKYLNHPYIINSAKLLHDKGKNVDLIIVGLNNDTLRSYIISKSAR